MGLKYEIANQASNFQNARKSLRGGAPTESFYTTKMACQHPQTRASETVSGDVVISVHTTGVLLFIEKSERT